MGQGHKIHRFENVAWKAMAIIKPGIISQLAVVKITAETSYRISLNVVCMNEVGDKAATG